ncbi:MAG: ATP-binding protein [Candidatus Woesearchaeota archaeon]|nr:ATP-binding protein [Candidatus Woesearchaeota archaeon]
MGLSEPQAHSIDTVVEHYVRGWHQKCGPLNIDPVRFEVRTSLQCPQPFLPYPAYRALSEVLDHLTENAMWAMSKIVWEDLDELFAKYTPAAPGGIQYTTAVDGDRAVLRVSDTGCGMNPDVFGIQASVPWHDSTGRTQDEYLVAQLNLRAFSYEVSTKGTSGCGLGISENIVERLGGRIFISGTTYEHDGRLCTIGEHNPDQSGTTITIRLPFDSRPPLYVID